MAYAEMQLREGHALSEAILRLCDLRAGTFSWEIDPSIDAEGQWGMPGDAVPRDARGSEPWRRLLLPFLRQGAVVVVEDPMIADDLIVVGPDDPDASVRRAFGLVGGAHRVVGIITRPHTTGTGVDDWIAAMTHLFFRGPSYDGLVLWTRPPRN